MDAMGAVRLKVRRTVVVVLLRAANVETIFLQAYPQVWTVGVALRTWFTLEESYGYQISIRTIDCNVLK